MGDSTPSSANVLPTLFKSTSLFTHSCGEPLLQRSFTTRTLHFRPAIHNSAVQSCFPHKTRVTEGERFHRVQTESRTLILCRSLVWKRYTAPQSDFPQRPGETRISLGTRTTGTAGRWMGKLGKRRMRWEDNRKREFKQDSSGCLYTKQHG